MAGNATRVGVLAVQGDFEAHSHALQRLGVEPVEVRTPEELEGIDGLIIPGGESTTIMKGLEKYGLVEPIRSLKDQVPILGTCAGMIVMSKDRLGLLDIDVSRNAFGRQIASFEADIQIDGLQGGPVHAVFIRAPWVESCGPNVTPLAEVDGHVVAVQEGRRIALSFHPEITGDLRVHTRFLELIGTRSLRQVA